MVGKKRVKNETYILHLSICIIESRLVHTILEEKNISKIVCQCVSISYVSYLAYQKNNKNLYCITKELQ